MPKGSAVGKKVWEPLLYIIFTSTVIVLLLPLVPSCISAPVLKLPHPLFKKTLIYSTHPNGLFLCAPFPLYHYHLPLCSLPMWSPKNKGFRCLVTMDGLDKSPTRWKRLVRGRVIWLRLEGDCGLLMRWSLGRYQEWTPIQRLVGNSPLLQISTGLQEVWDGTHWFFFSASCPSFLLFSVPQPTVLRVSKSRAAFLLSKENEKKECWEKSERHSALTHGPPEHSWANHWFVSSGLKPEICFGMMQKWNFILMFWFR